MSEGNSFDKKVNRKHHSMYKFWQMEIFEWVGKRSEVVDQEKQLSMFGDLTPFPGPVVCETTFSTNFISLSSGNSS